MCSFSEKPEGFLRRDSLFVLFYPRFEEIASKTMHEVKNMSIHDGHRQRLKERFLKEGLDNFDELQVLELLLFYGRARGDVNPLAHTLMDTFGSLQGVLEAK